MNLDRGRTLPCKLSFSRKLYEDQSPTLKERPAALIVTGFKILAHIGYIGDTVEGVSELIKWLSRRLFNHPLQTSLS